MDAHALERHVSTIGMWVDLGLMCRWCPADVMCDLSIRECVSELDMLCPCCRCAMTAGSMYVFGVRAGHPFRAFSPR